MRLHLRFKILLFLILITLLPGFQTSAQQNPFLTTSASEKSEISGSPSAGRTGILSAFTETALMREIRSVQKKIQAELSAFITAYKTDGDSGVLFTFLLFSYAYGLIHVIGPGHRKVFLFSYFISAKNKWRRGMAAGFLTAVLHAVSAVFLIGGLYFITSKTLLTRFNNLTPLIEKISYGIIVLLGLYLAVVNFIHHRKDSRGGADNGPTPGTVIFVLAAGLIPCPGAATIMIFSIAVQAPLAGIYSVLAMSLGMGTVLAFIPPAAILLQDKLGPAVSRWNPQTGASIHLAIAQAGALLMVLFGMMFLL